MRKTLELLIKGKDEASDELMSVGSSVTKLGSMAGMAASVGIAAAAAGVVVLGTAAITAAVGVAKLTMAAAEVEGVRNTFERLTDELGGSEHAMRLLKTATRGMVDETVLMQGTNKFLAMGLADTVEEAAQMAEMATQLGLAMGEEAGPSMENFALMLANQSIPRLDSFAISSGEARLKIEEMMEADKSLTREMAFTAVVMELGAAAMGKVGEQGDNAAAGMLRWQSSLEDLKLHIGQAFIPILELLQENFQPMIDEYGPRVVKWAEDAAGWLGDKLPLAMLILKDFMDGDFSNAFLNIGAMVEDAFGTETAIKFANFGKWLDEKLPIAAGVLSDFVTNTLLPALGDFKDWCDDFATDAAPAVVTASEDLQEGWEDITDTINNRLKPAWDDLNISLGTTEISIGEIFGVLVWAETHGVIAMTTVAVLALTAAVGVAGCMVDLLKAAFNWLVLAVKSAWKWITDLDRAIRNLVLPWWLEPGSPSPLETSLFGIAGAAAAAGGAMGTFNASLGGGGGGGGGGGSGGIGIPGGGMSYAGGLPDTGVTGSNVYITNHFGPNSVRTAQDIEDIANAIQRSFSLRGIRGVC